MLSRQDLFPGRPNTIVDEQKPAGKLVMLAFRRRRPASWGEQDEVGDARCSVRVRHLRRQVSGNCAADGHDTYLETAQGQQSVLNGPGSREEGPAILQRTNRQNLAAT